MCFGVMKLRGGWRGTMDKLQGSVHGTEVVLEAPVCVLLSNPRTACVWMRPCW